MHRLWIVPLLVGACASGSPAGAPARAPKAETETATLEVMTYNVNFGIEADPSSIAAIRRESSGLVLLQETTPGWEKSLRAALSSDYPYMAFRHSGAAGGLAILSKHEFVERELIDPPEGGWFPAWRLEVASPIGKLQILNVHLRPQLSESGSFVSGYFTTPKVRFAEMSRYFARLDPSLPTLVVGDFNEGRRGLAIAYLKKRGFKSALAQFDDSPTWRWPTSVGTVSAELDHIVYAPSLEPVEVRVVEAGRSDHLPVVGRFALRRDGGELSVE
jgi:endonuclease/exonuclease/phosphatase (EEP) superfamily protein YafD